MKKYLKTFERVFVYYFASMGVSVLVGVLLNVPLKLLLGNKFNDLLLHVFICAINVNC